MRRAEMSMSAHPSAIQLALAEFRLGCAEIQRAVERRVVARDDVREQRLGLVGCEESDGGVRRHARQLDRLERVRGSPASPRVGSPAVERPERADVVADRLRADTGLPHRANEVVDVLGADRIE